MFFHQLERPRKARQQRRRGREKKINRLREIGALLEGGEVDKPAVYEDQQLTHDIIGAAIEVHKHMGPGLLEGGNIHEKT